MQDVTFSAGPHGQWRIDEVRAVSGETLPDAERLHEHHGPAFPAAGPWLLHGFASNKRYTERDEAERLTARQAGLGRVAATRAVLIPLRKSEAWWALVQDERRAIFEGQSHHIAIGLDYLPGVARRLLHSRDLGEPFDFLTWFEFAPEYEDAFDHMLERLRATPEWRYVEREVDVRLTRDA